MSIKRRFTKEELDKLLRRSEETPIDELANELNMKRKALYKHIYAYKTELEFKKRFEEMLNQGKKINEICYELKIGLEEGEYFLALIEGRPQKKVKRKWSDEQKEKMYQLQCKGLTAREIAVIFDTTPTKIYSSIKFYKETKAIDWVEKNKEKMECVAAEKEILKPKPKKEKYKGPSIAELNKQAKKHNLSYGQYIAMKEMGLCQES